MMRDVCACRHNPLRVFAAHEVAAFCDPSMSTKMTVQFNLFGGTVRRSTDRLDYRRAPSATCLVAQCVDFQIDALPQWGGCD
eukprot:1059372-Pelagomonas_calceolata.AAC.18